METAQKLQLEAWIAGYHLNKRNLFFVVREVCQRGHSVYTQIIFRQPHEQKKK